MLTIIFSISAIITLAIIVYIIFLLEKMTTQLNRQTKILAEIAEKQGVGKFALTDILRN
jgi:flagellar biogenesis protein FliO